MASRLALGEFGKPSLLSTEARRSLEEESETLLRQGSVERRWSCRVFPFLRVHGINFSSLFFYEKKPTFGQLFISTAWSCRDFPFLRVHGINFSSLFFYEKKPTFGQLFISTAWSCRDSNPGPNKQSKRFLHAYPLVDCREITDERHTYYNLSLYISPVHQDLAKASSTFMMLRSGHR